MKKSHLWIMLTVLVLVTSCCTPRRKYERTLKRELSSGVRFDSLFFGIYLGMTSKDFYAHCWKLNSQGLVRQGSQNTSVEYFTKGELPHKASMNFYPTFYHDKIVEMPVVFGYTGWAPWNNEFSADKLQKDIRDWYSRVYGRGFIKVRHPVHGAAYIKIDGNRRITIFKENESKVRAIFRDMSSEMPEPDRGTKSE